VNNDRRAKLAEFVQWVADHITGDEKGQAQIFLDHLFRAFSQKGALEVGGILEQRIKKAADDGGGTSFADYVWKPIVLIEMKKRGEDLRRHYRQAFDYWTTRLVPGRPRYVVLCNFDEFHVYDFDRQVDEPVDKVLLTELPDRPGPLAFLFPTREQPVFGNDREKVTREAADKLATCYSKLEVRKVDPDVRQRFILQCLVALFAEDIGLLDQYTFARLLEECKTPADSYDLLGGLFEAMNREGGNPGGRYKGVRYFNGGIFQHPARVELYEDELNQLRQAAQSNWSKVSPEIFGTLFEHSMGKESRHAYGAHYTSQIDILKIVNPTIVNPWLEKINAAPSGKALLDLLNRLTTLRVLDPACGSGNFLYIAYREMKRLETRIRERLAADFPATQATLAHVNARQFFGMDINPFAVELAKVTMMIGRKLAIDELHISDEADLPLDNLDRNFLCVDALITRTPDGGAIQTPWPPADVIIGNPPFLDARKTTIAKGREYVAKLEELYPEIPRRADYCTYWIRRSHDHLPLMNPRDIFAGRAGLVGTQNIRNNESREGSLDHVVSSGTIIEAVENQPWSGEADVSVSIVNWLKTQDVQILPKARRLWSRTKLPLGRKKVTKRGVRADKVYELSERKCEFISPTLSDTTDVSGAFRLRANVEPKVVFEGIQTGHDGFVIDAAEAERLIRSDARNSKFLKRFLNGTDLLSGRYAVKHEFVVDLSELNLLEASSYPALIAIPRERVLADWKEDADKERIETGRARGEHQDRLDDWWALKRPRLDLQRTLARLSRYIACSAVMQRPAFVFLHKSFLPTNALKVFAFEDDYSFGIVQSYSHWIWFITKCSKLTERFRYTPDSVFDTFPWPQSPTKTQIDAVAAAGREVRRVRQEALAIIPGGLRAVYRTLEFPGKHPLKEAHAELDAAVLAAYGFSAKGDLLRQLLELNHAVAAREKAGQPVTAPGVPGSYGEASGLISADCIRPG
jgi:SAM-dependent methyltransferase